MAHRRIGQEAFQFGAKAGRETGLDELLSLIDWEPAARALASLYASALGEKAWPPSAMLKIQRPWEEPCGKLAITPIRVQSFGRGGRHTAMRRYKMAGEAKRKRQKRRRRVGVTRCREYRTSCNIKIFHSMNAAI